MTEYPNFGNNTVFGAENMSYDSKFDNGYQQAGSNGYDQPGMEPYNNMPTKYQEDGSNGYDQPGMEPYINRSNKYQQDSYNEYNQPEMVPYDFKSNDKKQKIDDIQINISLPDEQIGSNKILINSDGLSKNGRLHKTVNESGLIQFVNDEESKNLVNIPESSALDKYIKKSISKELSEKEKSFSLFLKKQATSNILSISSEISSSIIESASNAIESSKYDIHASLSNKISRKVQQENISSLSSVSNSIIYSFSSIFKEENEDKLNELRTMLKKEIEERKALEKKLIEQNDDIKNYKKRIDEMIEIEERERIEREIPKSVLISSILPTTSGIVSSENEKSTSIPSNDAFTSNISENEKSTSIQLNDVHCSLTLNLLENEKLSSTQQTEIAFPFTSNLSESGKSISSTQKIEMPIPFYSYLENIVMKEIKTPKSSYSISSSSSVFNEQEISSIVSKSLLKILKDIKSSSKSESQVITTYNDHVEKNIGDMHNLFDNKSKKDNKILSEELDKNKDKSFIDKMVDKSKELYNQIIGNKNEESKSVHIITKTFTSSITLKKEEIKTSEFVRNEINKEAISKLKTELDKMSIITVTQTLLDTKTVDKTFEVIVTKTKILTAPETSYLKEHPSKIIKIFDLINEIKSLDDGDVKYITETTTIIKDENKMDIGIEQEKKDIDINDIRSSVSLKELVPTEQNIDDNTITNNILNLTTVLKVKKTEESELKIPKTSTDMSEYTETLNSAISNKEIILTDIASSNYSSDIQQYTMSTSIVNNGTMSSNVKLQAHSNVSEYVKDKDSTHQNNETRSGDTKFKTSTSMSEYLKENEMTHQSNEITSEFTKLETSKDLNDYKSNSSLAATSNSEIISSDTTVESFTSLNINTTNSNLSTTNGNTTFSSDKKPDIATPIISEVSKGVISEFINLLSTADLSVPLSSTVSMKEEITNDNNIQQHSALQVKEFQNLIDEALKKRFSTINKETITVIETKSASVCKANEVTVTIPTRKTRTLTHTIYSVGDKKT